MFTIIAIIITLVSIVVFFDVSIAVIAFLGGWAIIPIGAIVFTLAFILTKLFGDKRET